MGVHPWHRRDSANSPTVDGVSATRPYPAAIAKVIEVSDPSSVIEESPRTLKVLFVEDDRATLYGLKRLAETRGWDVRAVRSGSEALSVLNGFLPDAAVIDIGLSGGVSGGSGIDLARQIRQVEAHAEMELIAHTGLTGEGTWMAAREEGFNARVIKPDMQGELISYLEALANRLS